jgi:hypothetical protein
MKAINLKIFGTFVLLFCMISGEAFAVDILIRKDDPAPGTISPTKKFKTTSLRTNMSKTLFVVPVSGELFCQELGIYFNVPVGTAVVTVEDQYGIYVVSQTLDTSASSELYFSTDGWESGNYTLRISYGSVNLIGEFQL